MSDHNTSPVGNVHSWSKHGPLFEWNNSALEARLTIVDITSAVYDPRTSGLIFVFGVTILSDWP